MKYKHIYFFTGVIFLSIIVLTATSFATNPLKEGYDTTYVDIKSNDLFVRHLMYVDEMDTKRQIENSEIIIVGEVIGILPTVETNDLIDSGILEARNKGYNYVHTDVVIRVDKYIGQNNLDYDEVVVRHLGGRINNFVHYVEMEHLNIGEVVMLFRLEQPTEMTQIPKGYNKEQYFLFQPNSKYVQDVKGQFYSENNPEEKVELNEVLNILEEKAYN